MNSKLNNLLNKYHGTITTKLVSQNGISRSSLAYAVSKNEIEKEYPGVYVCPGEFADEIFWRSNTLNGIVSHDTALDLYSYTNTILTSYDFTFKAGYHNSNLSKMNVNAHYDKYTDKDIIVVLTPNGNPVKSTNRERTLCDIFRSQTTTRFEKINALKKYLRDPERNLTKMSNYIERYNLTELKNMIGVLE